MPDAREQEGINEPPAIHLQITSSAKDLPVESQSSSGTSVKEAEAVDDDSTQSVDDKKDELHACVEGQSQTLTSSFNLPNAGAKVIQSDRARFAGNAAALPTKKQMDEIDPSELDNAKRDVIETFKACQLATVAVAKAFWCLAVPELCSSDQHGTDDKH